MHQRAKYYFNKYTGNLDVKVSLCCPSDITPLYLVVRVLYVKSFIRLRISSTTITWRQTLIRLAEILVCYLLRRNVDIYLSTWGVGHSHVAIYRCWLFWFVWHSFRRWDRVLGIYRILYSPSSSSCLSGERIRVLIWIKKNTHLNWKVRFCEANTLFAFYSD